MPLRAVVAQPSGTMISTGNGLASVIPQAWAAPRPQTSDSPPIASLAAISLREYVAADPGKA